MSSEGVLIVEAEGRIKSANSAAERLLGYGRGELAGLEAEKVLDGQRHIGWSRRNGFVLVYQRDVELPAQPRRVTGSAEVDIESLHLLENELLLVAGLAEMSLLDRRREDLERLTRAAARAAVLCREAAPVKTATLTEIQLQDFLLTASVRLRGLLDPEVAIELGRGSGVALASPPLLEQALLSLVIHLPKPRRVRLGAAVRGRIEMTVLMVAEEDGVTWRRVLSERQLPRPAAWLAAQGATMEEDVAEGGAGHRFRIHLAPVC